MEGDNNNRDDPQKGKATQAIDTLFDEFNTLFQENETTYIEPPVIETKSLRTRLDAPLLRDFAYYKKNADLCNVFPQIVSALARFRKVNLEEHKKKTRTYYTNLMESFSSGIQQLCAIDAIDPSALAYDHELRQVLFMPARAYEAEFNLYSFEREIVDTPAPYKGIPTLYQLVQALVLPEGLLNHLFMDGLREPESFGSYFDRKNATLLHHYASTNPAIGHLALESPQRLKRTSLFGGKTDYLGFDIGHEGLRYQYAILWKDGCIRAGITFGDKSPREQLLQARDAKSFIKTVQDSEYAGCCFLDASKRVSDLSEQYLPSSPNIGSF